MYARKYYLAVSILISETFHSLRPDHPAPPFFFKCVCVWGGTYCIHKLINILEISPDLCNLQNMKWPKGGGVLMMNLRLEQH